VQRLHYPDLGIVARKPSPPDGSVVENEAGNTSFCDVREFAAADLRKPNVGLARAIRGKNREFSVGRDGRVQFVTLEVG
jgi:hypothetical protein